VGYTNGHLETRLEEHQYKPVNARMKEAFEKYSCKIECLQEFYCINERRAKMIEKQYIQNEHPTLNDKHNRIQEPQTPEPTPYRTIKLPKLNPTDEPQKNRFKIRSQHRELAKYLPKAISIYYTDDTKVEAKEKALTICQEILNRHVEDSR
jgi:hypothetical protein